MVKGAATVVVNIIGKADELKRSLDQADRELGGFSNKLDAFGKKTMATGAKFTAGLTLPIVAGLGAATKAAVEDEAAQAKLANTLENTVGATDSVVRSVEAHIAKMMQASTFADDELRPAYENLVRETRNVQEANTLLATAMDLAAAKGISVEAASMILVKAHNGQTRALKDLGVETKNTEGTAASYADIMRDVNEVVGGAAAAAAETAAGKTKILQRDMGELVETLGVALVPMMEKVVGWIQTLTDKFTGLSPQMQTGVLVVGLLAAAIGPAVTLVGAMATAVGGLTTATIALNAAMLKNPLVVGVTALVAGMTLIYVASERITGGFDGIKGSALSLAETIRNLKRDVQNLIDTFEELTHLGLGNSGDSWFSGNPLSKLPGIGDWFKASGGPVSAGSPYIVGERGPELFVPGQSGSIVANGALRGPSGGGGPTVIQLMLDGRKIAEVVHGEFLEKQRRTGALGLT
jgi:hypothetical protein